MGGQRPAGDRALLCRGHRLCRQRTRRGGLVWGTGRGRDTLANRLSDFLDKYEVLAFTPLQITKRDDGLACRVQYHYRHRQTGMEIDGSMRLLWSIAGDKATSLKVIHDAVRMGVFFEMADRCSRGDLYM